MADGYVIEKTNHKPLNTYGYIFTYMVEPERFPSDEPLAKARLIRLLKDRPRLINRGVREEFLEQLQKNVEERRVPDTFAERTVQTLLNRVVDSAQPVMKDRIKKKAESANEGPLQSL